MLVLVIFLSLQWLVNCVTTTLTYYVHGCCHEITIHIQDRLMVLFVNTAFLLASNLSSASKIVLVLVLVLKDLSSALALASRICPRLTSLTSNHMAINIEHSFACTRATVTVGANINTPQLQST